MSSSNRGRNRDLGSFWRLKQSICTAKQMLNDKVLSKRSSLSSNESYYDDEEFEAKLNLFNSLKNTSITLTRICGLYIRCIDQLASVEGDLALHFGSHRDKTVVFGSSDDTLNCRTLDQSFIVFSNCFSLSASMRSSLKQPLIRLHNEVAVFHRKALSDTDQTLSQLMKLRLDFKSALIWLRDISDSNLDPEVPKSIRRYQQVQNLVKERKDRYDGIKDDISEKIDMLCASRCNIEIGCDNVLMAYCQDMRSYWTGLIKPISNLIRVLERPIEYQFSALEQLNGISNKPYTIDEKNDDNSQELLIFSLDNEAEDDKKQEDLLMDLSLDVEESQWISVTDEKSDNNGEAREDLITIEKSLWENELSALFDSDLSKDEKNFDLADDMLLLDIKDEDLDDSRSKSAPSKFIMSRQFLNASNLKGEELVEDKFKDLLDLLKNTTMAESPRSDYGC